MESCVRISHGFLTAPMHKNRVLVFAFWHKVRWEGKQNFVFGESAVNQNKSLVVFGYFVDSLVPSKLTENERDSLTQLASSIDDPTGLTGFAVGLVLWSIC